MAPQSLSRASRHHITSPETIQIKIAAQATSTRIAHKSLKKVGCWNPPRKCIRSTTRSHLNCCRSARNRWSSIEVGGKESMSRSFWSVG